MKSAVWYNRFFENEEQKIPNPSPATTESNAFQLNIALPTAVDNDAGAPFSTHYYSVAHRKKWCFRASQCRSANDFYALYADIENEYDYLGQLQKSLLDMIKKYEVITNQTEYNEIYRNIYSLIEVTKARFTVIEMDYYLFISEAEISNTKRLLEKKYSYKIQNVLNFLAVANYQLCVLTEYDIEQTKKLRHILFSIFSSLRNTTIFPAIEGVGNSISEAPSFLSILTTCYFACYCNDIKFFNMHYFKQIIGEELQANLDFYDKYACVESYSKPVFFKMVIRSIGKHTEIASMYFKMQEYKSAIMHLERAVEDVMSIVHDMYDHLEVRHEFPFGKIMPEETERGLPKLQLLAHGGPRIEELQDRVHIVESLQKIIFTVLDPHMDCLEKLAKTDKEIFSMVRNLRTVIALINQSISQNKSMDAVQKINHEFAQLVKEMQPEHPEPVENVKKDEPVLEKQKQRNMKDYSRTREVYTSLPSNLPNLTFTPSVEVKETLTKDPTIRISDDEREKNIRLKQQRYKEVEKKKADLLAQKQSEEKRAQNSNIFEYEFKHVTCEKMIKARLDNKACIDVMGEREFYQILPDLIDILEKGRNASWYGTGIKFVPKGEKEGKFPKELSKLSCFKIKPRNHKVRIYGLVVEENGESRITFNMPAFGKLHDTVAHLPKFKI